MITITIVLCRHVLPLWCCLSTVHSFFSTHSDFMLISLIISFLATWIIISIPCDSFPSLSPASWKQNQKGEEYDLVVSFKDSGRGIDRPSLSPASWKQNQKGEEYDLVVSFKDSGRGIDPEVLAKLFERFVSKSFSGTGLGLFISKSIVEAHGGKIWAENNKDGKGATFSFSLPIVNKTEISWEINRKH